MTKVVELEPTPNQVVSFPYAGLFYRIEIETRRGRLYASVDVGGEPVIRNRVLRAYAPIGYGLQLVDVEGTEDPHYDGLGERWFLMVDSDEG